MKIPFCLIFISTFLVFANYAITDFSDDDILLNKLKEELIKAKFQNIVIILDSKILTISYENKAYADEIYAIKKIIGICLPTINDNIRLVLVPKNRGIPLAFLSINCEEKSNLCKVPSLDASISINQTINKSLNLDKANPHSFNLGIMAYPQIGAQFGDYDSPVRLFLYFAPKVQMDFPKGMSFLAQAIIPIQNEINRYNAKHNLAILALNETFRIKKDIFISATIGHFTNNCYGFDLILRKYFYEGKLFFETDIGYTKRNFEYPFLLTAIINTEYYIYRYDLSLSASYGKYLYGDIGLSVGMLRYFKRSGIGIFFSNTQADSNLGISLCMPSFLERHKVIGFTNIGMIDRFSWKYRYKGFSRSAIRYETGYGIDETMKFINISNIKNQIKFNEDLH